jgi:hypothetical protein
VNQFWSFVPQLPSHLRWVKVIWSDVENSRKNEKLLIRNVPKSDFDLTNGGPADVEARHLTARRELPLAEFHLAACFTNLWTDHIGRMFFSGHCSTKSSLTLFEKLIKSCYARVTEPFLARRAMAKKMNKSTEIVGSSQIAKKAASGPNKPSTGRAARFSRQSNDATLEIKRSILTKLSVRIRELRGQFWKL